ncbi:hypothetical protein T07_9236 [Trichinella nelsoni]|uniref:Uncharacterized protein n=1 Tax=Trichinella nelsoni TaxID=6336 RepID=A0A0V0SFX7_9BILA|nr:hypothetical protein T07_9236 [Trichinella nelsoni]
MSLVYEGRDKEGCGGAVWTDLEVPAGIDSKDHVETCRVDEHLAYKMEKKALLKKRSAEETKLIPAIYGEEVSAASAESSTSGQFPVFKRVRARLYKNQCFNKVWGRLFLLWQSASKHILVFSTSSNIRLLATIKPRGTDGTFKLSTIHATLASKLVPVICCYVRVKILANKTLINKAAVLSVNLYPQTIICNFEITLIRLC